MTRLAVAMIALAGMVSVGAQEASALSARNRLCVQSARQLARNTIRTQRSEALSKQRADIIKCFGPSQSPTNDCATRCTNNQTACLQNNVTDPRALCDQSTEDNDGVTSCREAFDAAILVCKAIKKPNSDEPDFDQQLVCQSNARATRFLCTQRCAAAVQPAQDQCGVDFADCLELCG